MRTGTGNLLEAPTEALVNTVNCVGIMGKGIALQFSKAWPAMYAAYRRAAEAGEVVPGRMHVYETGQLVGPRFIINFPTKRHWREPSRLEDIEAGLPDLVRVLRTHGIRSVAVPPLGAGLGGLDWRRVRPRIEAALAPLDDVDVLLWEPAVAPPAEQRPVHTRRPRMTLARALVLALMDRYRLLDHEVTHLEVQKLAYFLQLAVAREATDDRSERRGAVGRRPERAADTARLGMKFEAQAYGPYADGLYHMLQQMEGHQIVGLSDRSPHAPLQVLPGAVEEAWTFLKGEPVAQAGFDRVARLIEGFETPYGMELLATVHWVTHREPECVGNVGQCVERIHAWSERKRRVLKPEHIQLGWARLQGQGWLPPHDLR